MAGRIGSSSIPFATCYFATRVIAINDERIFTAAELAEESRARRYGGSVVHRATSRCSYAAPIAIEPA